MGKRTNIIGRSETASMQGLDDQASRKHLKLRFDKNTGRHLASDMNSHNGVFLNDRQIKGEVCRATDTKLDRDVAIKILTEPPSIRRLEVKLGVEGNLAVDARRTTFRLSPDGSTLAFLVRQTNGSDEPKFYIRRLTQLKATPRPAADGALAFCFSPDGQSIAFADTNTLKRIDVFAGQSTPLAENMEGGFGGPETRVEHLVGPDSMGIEIK